METKQEYVGGAAAVEKLTPSSADLSPLSLRKGMTSEVISASPTTTMQPPLVTHTTVPAQPTSPAPKTIPPQPTAASPETAPAQPLVTAKQPNAERPPVSTSYVDSLEGIEKEGKRLFTETRQLLQLHSEHAMTLSELVERFTESGEPSRPSMEKLYQLLTKFNVKEDGQGNWKPTKVLQVCNQLSGITL